MSEVNLDPVVIDVPNKNIQITVDHINGYIAIEQEEVAATLGCLDITMQQINSCDSVDEIERLFDEAMEASPIKNGEEHVARRLCRAITLVGLMTNTPIPIKYHLIDGITCKAAGMLLKEQQTLQAGEQAEVAETTVQ